MYSIYKPVYLKGKAMESCRDCSQQSKSPRTRSKKQREDQPRQSPGPSHDESDTTSTSIDEDDEFHIPVLICRRGVMLVYPHEATRDVITGKVPYYYADDTGCTKYDAKHMFCALRLNRKQRDQFGEYPLAGGHERFLPKKERKRPRRHSYDLISRYLHGVSTY